MNHTYIFHIKTCLVIVKTIQQINRCLSYNLFKYVNKHYQEAHLTAVAGILENPFNGTYAVLCFQKRQMFEMTDEVVPLLVGFEL